MRSRPERAATERTPFERWIAVGLAIGGLIAMAAILLDNRHPPLFADYVEWVYHGVLLRDWLQGHPNSLYVLKNYPVPNSLTTLGLGTLMLAMPWQAAAKIWLLIEVSLGLWCADRLRRSCGDGQSWQVVVVAASALLGINLWYGFTNFQFGTYFAMLFCSLLLQKTQSRWAYGALLVLLFFSHMIPFGFALCLLVLYAMQSGRWHLLWQALPAMLLCLWYFAGRFSHSDVDGTSGMQASVPYGSLLFFGFRINTYLKCWGFVNTVSNFQDSILLRLTGTTTFVLLFALNLLIGIAFLILIARTARKAIAQRSGQSFFWLAVSLFFIVGLIMPGAAAGISDPGGRMLQVAVWCAACVTVSQSQWTGRLLASCSVALMAFSIYQIHVVAERPPMIGSVDGPLPARMRQFGHVAYLDHSTDYDSIDQKQMNVDIYPTAMFLEKPKP